MTSSPEPTPLLPVRIERNGWTVIQDGVILCLFVRASHRDLAEHAGRLYDRWLEIVGPDSVQWYRGADDWKPLTPRQRMRLRKQMTTAGATKADTRVAMKGGGREDDVTVHGFDYWGSDLTDAPDEASFVELRFGTEWVQARGMDAFAELAIELAAMIPYSSGYASLAFHVDMIVPGFIDEHAFDHPGMDVHANEYTALYLGDRVRGAYWLTFVGPVALAALGGAAELRRALGREITVVEAGQGVAIRAGDELRPGDVAAGDDLPLTRKVASVIEPVRLHQTLGAFGFTAADRHEKFLAWQRRHLT